MSHNENGIKAKKFLQNIVDNIPGMTLIEQTRDPYNNGNVKYYYYLKYDFDGLKFQVDCISRDTRNEHNALFWNIEHRFVPYGFSNRMAAIFGKDVEKLNNTISDFRDHLAKKKLESEKKDLELEDFRNKVNEKINQEFIPENIFTTRFDITCQDCRVEISRTSSGNLFSTIHVYSWRSEESEVLNLNREMGGKIKDLEEQIKKVKEEYSQKMISATKIFKKDN